MKDFLVDNCYVGGFKNDVEGNIKLSKKKGVSEPKYILTPKLYAYVMKSGTKSFHQTPVINLDIARTILKTMGNRHRAGVDNYVTHKGRIRKLTPRECLRLMGFKDTFKIVVSDTSMYQQAGNSIVVDVLIALLKQLDITKYGIEIWLFLETISISSVKLKASKVTGLS